MAKRLNTIQELQDYFSGVVERAEHHAQNVEKIIYPLLGMIIKYKDSGTGIEVWGKEGNTGNLLWIKIKGKRYAFRYDHPSVSIEIHEETYTGKLIKSLTNKSTLHQLRSVFDSL